MDPRCGKDRRTPATAADSPVTFVLRLSTTRMVSPSSERCERSTGRPEPAWRARLASPTRGWALLTRRRQRLRLTAAVLAATTAAVVTGTPALAAPSARLSPHRVHPTQALASAAQANTTPANTTPANAAV